jgi:hypothetical protein
MRPVTEFAICSARQGAGTLHCAALVACFLLPFGCRDASRFTTGSGVFEGMIAQSSFVRAGIGPDVRMCMTFDAERMQDAPGLLSTSDGRFRATPLRPIPQLWHDALSTLEFGDGRSQNLVYVAATERGDAGASMGEDVLVVVSLMQSGGLEVRFLRGAPSSPSLTQETTEGPLFAVFSLRKQAATCSF